MHISTERPLEPFNRFESPEQWAEIADWEERRADFAEKKLAQYQAMLSEKPI